MLPDQNLVDDLAIRALNLVPKAGGELERCCWMVVHEQLHGVRPSEYDIREIDEALFLAVLTAVKQVKQGS